MEVSLPRLAAGWPNARTTSPNTEHAGLDPGDVVVGPDGTFDWKDLGKLKGLPSQPSWIVHRKKTAENWCLLCDCPAETWNGHLDGKKHLATMGSPKDWMPDGLRCLLKSGSQKTEDEPREERTSATTSSSTGAVTTGPNAQTSSSSCAAMEEPWYTQNYPLESTMAVTHGDAEPISKIATRTTRIRIGRDDLSVNAVWLAPGRPGYLI